MPRNAVFLDRDGTIAVDVRYCRRPEAFQLLPRAGEAIALLNRAGLAVVVVTNQSAIGRGDLTEAVLGEIHAKMRRELAQAGARIDAIYHCPHLPEAGCACRKPAGALFHRAATELGISLPDSYMVGDKAIYILSGRAVGSRTVLVRSDQSPASTDTLAPDHEALTLYEAVRWILRSERASAAHGERAGMLSTGDAS